MVGHADRAVDPDARRPPGQGVLALRPDGRALAVGIDHGVQLVDVDSGDVTVTTGLPEGPNSLRFSPDGGTLVSANGDGTVTLLDAESASRRGTLHGHADAVRQLVFTHDGSTLYTVSADGATIAWDLTETRSIRRSFASRASGTVNPQESRASSVPTAS